MDKRQYKQLMEQIQMSDACEQRILNAVHQTKIPQLKSTSHGEKEPALPLRQLPVWQSSASFL